MGNTAAMIETIAGTAAATCVVIAAAARAMRSAYRWLTRFEDMINTVEKRTVTVEKRSEQLVPNGGSSMRDAVDSIRSSVDQQAQDLKMLHQRIDEIAAATPRAAPGEPSAGD